MKRLSDRDRRAVLGLVVAVAIYLSASFVVFPAYDRISFSRDDVSKQEEQLRKYRRALLRKDQYGQLIQRANDSIQQVETRFFSTEKGSAELQAIVESTAGSAGLTLSQRNLVAERKRDALVSEVSMTLTCEATLAQILNFMNQLRQSSKFLTVSAAQLTPVQPLRELPGPGAEFKKSLKANLTVTGLMLNPAGGAR